LDLSQIIGGRGILIDALCLVLCSCLAMAQSPSDPLSRFRPRNEVPGVEYAGREACARCHIQRARFHTGMENALLAPKDSAVLRSHPRLTFRAGEYSYEISSDGAQALFKVSDGKQTITEPIAYAFGNAHVAQTYVLRHRGKLYEGRASYYAGIDGLDWTIGDVLNPPPSLEEAFGRDIDSDEARNCFSCHGTSAVTNGKLDLSRLTMGVSCEACHGPGAKHIAAISSGSGENLYIFNPKVLDADTLSQEFCGACHRSADTVAMMPDLGGLNNVRFQPYRMANSRGHDMGDTHFRCTSCHDPHVDLNQDMASYDSDCIGCHALRRSAAATKANQVSRKPAASRNGKSCPVAPNQCVSCHMPKVELPGAHFKFTDHRIRIVRPSEKYPV